MRLFIGISPTDDVRRVLVKAQNYLQRHGITGSYLTPENLHMTLAFIGEYPEIAPEFARKLSGAVTFLNDRICTGETKNPWLDDDYIDRGLKVRDKINRSLGKRR